MGAGGGRWFAIGPRRLSGNPNPRRLRDYPPAARRARTTGSVTVSFTVRADGSVDNVRILDARPRGLFERNVQITLRRWRFQPIAQAQTVTRTIEFKP